MEPLTEIADETLRAICARHRLPFERLGRLPSTGIINSIYTVGDDVLLRIPHDTSEGWKDTLTESVAVPAAIAAGVRTPALLAFDESCEVVDVPFGIYEWVHAPHGWPRSPEGWQDLGRQLATLHHGVTECPDPQGRLDQPGRWCSVDEVLDAEALAGIDPALRAAVESALRPLEPAVRWWEERGVRQLQHDDVKASNLLIDGDVAWVIDWGDAGWGDGAIDFRLIPPQANAAIMAGYGEVAAPDDGFEDRVRWDQLTALAARHHRPTYLQRLAWLLT